MKLHWSPRSPYVRKVMIAAHELGLAERLELARTVVAMSAPNAALMADNPLSKIPTLVLDDGRVLFDSHVIIDYLDVLAGGGRLIPPVGEARWQALTWHALGNGLLDVLILLRNEREKPEERRTPEWLVAFARKADAALDVMEQAAPALGAAPFGIGHIAIASALGYLDFRFSDLDWRSARPELAAWQGVVKERPSLRATEIVDG